MDTDKAKGKAWRVVEFGKPLVLVDTTFEQLEDDEVLVEVQAAPINPSDALFINGQYVRKALPAGCGFEGVGRVVKAGGSSLHVLDKRVCFLTSEGSWATHVKLKIFGAIPIRPDVNLVSAACGQVNPLTVLGLLDCFQRSKAKALVQTAAASQLGKMLLRSAAARAITVINLVRRAEQVEQLRKLGAEHVVCTADQDWQGRLKTVAQRLGATACFDCVGGQLAAKILSALPAGAKMWIYGNLSMSKTIPLNLQDIIGGKSLQSFNLTEWLAGLQAKDRARIYSQHSDLLQKELRSELQTTFTLEDLPKALQHYRGSSRSNGKILILPK